MKPSNIPDAAEAQGRKSDLVHRYEQIGISAVAGALACEKAAGKKAEPARVESDIKERDLQITA